MLAKVNWSPQEFLKQFFWLSLDPPLPEHGLKILPPLKEGGWWLMAGFFLTTSILLWWARMYSRARALGMGTHVPWAFAAAIFLYLVARLHPAAADGFMERGRAFRHLPASRLDEQLLAQPRQPLLQPVPHALDRLPLWLGGAVCHARRHHPGRQPAGRRARDRADRRPRHGLGTGRPVLEVDHGLQCHDGIRSIAGPGGSPSSAR